MRITLHCGHTIDEDGTRTNYIMDDDESLGPAIRDYHTIEHDGGFLEILEAVLTGELDGTRYVVSICDLYYETVEEVDGESSDAKC